MDKVAKFIFTGGRDYKDKDTVARILASITGGIDFHVAVGCCPTGLDKFVRDLVPKEFRTVYKADWKQFDRAAGPKRNREMVLANPGAIVIAFPGGAGTNNCVHNALGRKHIVMQVQ